MLDNENMVFSCIFLQYSSRLSLHSCVPFMRVLFTFIWVNYRSSRVTCVLDFSCCIIVRVECYTRVRFRVFCMRVRLLLLHSSQELSTTRELDFVCSACELDFSVLHASKILCVKSSVLHVNKTW